MPGPATFADQSRYMDQEAQQPPMPQGKSLQDLMSLGDIGKKLYGQATSPGAMQEYDKVKRALMYLILHPSPAKGEWPYGK